MMVTILVIAVLWFLSAAFMTTVNLTGDERANANAARAIASFLRGAMPFERMQADVVGFGWFTPGMALFLTPLYLTDLTPSLLETRIYTSILSLVLWSWAIWKVHHAFGRHYALALLFFPTLDITWRLFSSTVWGDLPAGVLLTVALAQSFRIARLLVVGQPAPIREVIGLQIVLASAFYLRGNLIAVAAAVNLFLLALPVVTGYWRQMARHAAVMVLGVSVFAAAIAPWSIMASRQLGGLVVSTTTPALSFGITFGNGEMCFARCPGKVNLWVETVHFSRLYGKLAGISELEAQQRMAAYAVRNLDLHGYLYRVRSNLRRFLLDPATFVGGRFLPSSTLKLSEEMIATGKAVSTYWTSLLFFPGLFALALANLAVVRGRNGQVESLLLKLMTLCLFVQPFVHVSHSRYWPAFAPLMAISAVFVWRQATGKPDDPGFRSLWLVQGLYVAFVVTICAALVLAGFNLL